MDAIDIESCRNNGRCAKRRSAAGFNPAGGPSESVVLQPLNALRIAAARAKKPSPLTEPKRLTIVLSVGESARHDSDKLSLSKLSAPGPDLEGEHERPIPAYSLTNDALDQRREFVGHLQAGKRHVR